MVISPFEDGVVAILKHRIADDDEEAIISLLERYHIRCATSLPFQPFSYLHFAYLQCRAVMQMSSEDQTGRFSSFSDSYQDYVIESLSMSASLQALCESRILELSKSERGMEFVRSLHSYLMNGWNMAAASRKLYLHRNTLIYRIERMQQILEVDFDTAPDDELFRLILSCSIAERGL